MKALLMLCLALPLLAADEDLLLADDFEDGFSKGWLHVSEGIAIVPEDPAKPDGNQVARLSRFGQDLFSPPARPGDLKGAREKEAEYERWDNYDFSFRFRLSPVENKRMAPGNTCTFMRVTYRSWPAEGNLHECQLLWLQAWRPRLTWRLAGPNVAWFSRHDGYARRNIVAIHEDAVGGQVDTEWHRLSIRCIDDRVRIFRDGKLWFDGRDDRVLAGGIGISHAWQGQRTVPGHIDIDDVVVRRIQAFELDAEEAAE